MRRTLTLMCALLVAAACATDAQAAGGRDRPATLQDRIEELQQEVDSLSEDIDDLREPVEEFDLFDQCAFTLGVTQYGSWDGNTGFLFEPGRRARRPALAMDMRGFGRAQYQFLAFPGEEPPSIECNEDAGEEFIDG